MRVKSKKIAETVLIFLAATLTVCSIASFVMFVSKQINLDEIVGKIGIYFLYTIGYGALDGEVIIQNILAVLGIIILALTTTYLTIRLFWRTDDVILSKEVIYNDKVLEFRFINYGEHICDVKATFLLYDDFINENIAESKEYYMPMILKKSNWNLKVNLDDTFWYKLVCNILSDNHKKLYCLFSFVDTKNGQSSIRVEEITKEIMKNLKYEDITKPAIIECSRLMACENDGGKITRMEVIDGLMEVDYSFKSKDSGFIMAYYNYHGSNLNLEKYEAANTSLEFTAMSKERLILSVEIKSNNSNWSKEFEITEVPQKFEFELQDKRPEDDLEKIREICFTVFSHSNKLENSFKLGNLQVITK